jgi:hypothetical protein
MKINGMEVEDLEYEFSDVIKNEETTDDELFKLIEFFKTMMYVSDNEYRNRMWKKFKEGKLKT